MFNFSKSVSTPDLQNKKSDVQYRVICDWLRTIVNNQIQTKKRITLLEEKVELILIQSDPPKEDRTPLDYDNRSDTQI